MGFQKNLVNTLLGGQEVFCKKALCLRGSSAAQKPWTHRACSQGTTDLLWGGYD